MVTTIRLDQIVIDDIDTISKELEEGTGFRLKIYDSNDSSLVGVWLESEDQSKSCTIMFYLTKQEALFLGESLVTLSKII